MTTMKQLLQNCKIGEPITNKKILYFLKRKNLLWDYSQWGYLEGIRIVCKDNKNQPVEFDLDLSPNAKANVAETFENALYIENNKKYRQCTAHTDKSYNELKELFGHPHDTIKIFDMEFDKKYFSGCFNPYLVRIN